MEVNTYKRIVEASYLTAEKASTYRAILRYFYIEHERMRESLFPEEIYAYIQELSGFSTYTVEQLQHDLDQLVKWNNLVATQEMGRARSIEEFKKKRFRYQSTPYTIEFERMLQAMEQGGGVFGGSLEKKEFERLYQTLNTIETIIKKEQYPSADECYQIWNDLFTYFRSITQNTSDYFAHLNSAVAEERMQTEAFLVFKDQFTTYLRDFIIGLQQTAGGVQEILETIPKEKLLGFIQEIITYQKQVPRFEDQGLSDEELAEDYLGKWRTIKEWFLGGVYRESELEILEIRTNEQIRRITRVVQRLGERHHYFRSRKKDYLHLAKWFDSLDALEDAHQLSAVTFGVFNTRHLFSDHVPTENIYTDVWEEIPIQHETKPRIRNYREKTRAGAITSNTEKKEAARLTYIKEKQAEQEVLEKYMQGNEIILGSLPQIEIHIRKMLLGWIGKAMAKKDRTFKTEHGRTVEVILSETERIVLPADDGLIEMPAVTFRFRDEVNI